MKNALDTSWVDYTSTTLTLLELASEFQSSQFKGSVLQGNDRGWDGWMVSLTQWTWVWASSGSWWWTGRPGVLKSMGKKWDTTKRLNWTELTRLPSSPRCQLQTCASDCLVITQRFPWPPSLFFFFWCGPFVKSLLNVLHYCFCCFYALAFCPWRIWDPRSLGRDPQRWKVES